jgi:hypothetical protein
MADDIDVLAAHVVPLDVWYVVPVVPVVPVAALAAGTSLRLYPDDGCKTARFEKYREGWDLFRGETVEVASEGESVAPGPELNPGDGAGVRKAWLDFVLLSGDRGFLGVKAG